MIDIKIGLNGVPSLKRVILSNKYENNDEFIQFELPTDFDNYHKYVIAIIKQKVNNTTQTTTRVLPITNDNKLYISTKLTYIAGNWNIYVMCRQQEVDLSQDEVDISAKKGEHVFISDGFIGVVNANLIESDYVNNEELDTNLKPIYEELLALKRQCEELLQIPNANEVMY